MKSKSCFIKCLIITVAAVMLCITAGCSSDFVEPFDFNGLKYEYEIVSSSDSEYVVINKLTVSETDVVIPDTIYGVPVAEIAESAFSDNTEIRSVTFGKNVKHIGNQAFAGCTSLESVVYDTALNEIGKEAFYGCTSLKSFALTVTPTDISNPQSIIIDDSAFNKCTALESIEFIQSAASIGDMSFAECTSLKSVSLPDGLQSVGRGAFYGCTSLSNIKIPDTLSDIGGRAFAETPWLKAKSKTKFVTVGNGVLIQYNGNLSKVKLPSGVKSISGAFAGNTDIVSITLNNDLKSIGDMAFMGCTSLKSINIPSKVTEIGDEAFYNCKSLKSISLSAAVESIGKDAFKYCGAEISMPRNSAAHKYCADNEIEYSFNDE